MTDPTISALFQQATTPRQPSSSSPLSTLMSLMQMGSFGGPPSSSTGMPSLGPGTGAPSVPGSGLQQWIHQAEQAAGVASTPQMDNMLNILIQHESGGNPTIVNKTPTPGGYHAEGLAQMIPPTFQHYSLGIGGIDNPVANLAAAIKYMIDRYGSVANTPGIASVLAGHGYQPY